MDQERPLRERLIDVGVDPLLTGGSAAVGPRTSTPPLFERLVDATLDAPLGRAAS
ncbi:hypothetical protein ACFV7Q_13410 [Streptomyces sp. NPDC059851]|uniref:hypothetical protein n=1 Tax=Streptomyces sp. NPDC059851 TaxID=3346971 RepID=UPI00364C1FFC